MIKKCKICNREFNAKTNGFLCSLNCKRKHTKIWQQKHYQRYKKTVSKKAKKYYKQNKKHIKRRTKQYREHNKEYYKTYMKEYSKNNREKFNKNNQKWRRKNSDYNKKYRENIQNHLAHKISNRIRMALKRNSKSLITEKLIGCPIKYLKQYLENQFKKGMSWDLFKIGKIHVDHIRPCCKFDLSKKSEQQQCFNYKNLQPLWAKENLSKGGK